MKVPQNIVTLITDAKKTYTQSALNIIGLPSGSRVRLRYDLKYVQSALHSALSSDELKGAQVALFFLDNNDGEFLASSVTAMRECEVCYSEVMAEHLMMEVSLGGFIQFKNEQGILYEEFKEGMLAAGPKKKNFIFCLDALSEEIESSDSPHSWANVAVNLSAVSDLSKLASVNIEGIFEGEKAAKIKDGVFQLRAGKQYQIRIRAIAESNEARVRKYNFLFDNDLVKMPNLLPIEIQMRHDRYDRMLKTNNALNSSQTTLSVIPESDDGAPSFSLSLAIKPSYTRLVVSRLPLAMFSSLIALAGMLPESVGFEIRAIIGLVGAMGLAITSSVK